MHSRLRSKNCNEKSYWIHLTENIERYRFGLTQSESESDFANDKDIRSPYWQPLSSELVGYFNTKRLRSKLTEENNLKSHWLTAL